MRIARRAGTKQANSATKTSSADATTKVKGSKVPIPKRRPRNNRAIPSATTSPIPAPHKARVAPSRRISWRIVAGFAPKSNTNTDFPRTLCDRIGDHAINSHHREKNRYPCKNQQQEHVESLRNHGFLDRFLHGSDICGGQLRIKIPYKRLNGSSQSRRIHLG